MSIVIVCNPSGDQKVGPLKDMVDESNPMKYREMTFNEYQEGAMKEVIACTFGGFSSSSYMGEGTTFLCLTARSPHSSEVPSLNHDPLSTIGGFWISGSWRNDSTRNVGRFLKPSQKTPVLNIVEDLLQKVIKEEDIWKRCKKDSYVIAYGKLV
ncbi:hypothetical protein KI387_000757, partial [Taxus chinensis]